MTTNPIHISYYRSITSPANSNSKVSLFLPLTPFVGSPLTQTIGIASWLVSSSLLPGSLCHLSSALRPGVCNVHMWRERQTLHCGLMSWSLPTSRVSSGISHCSCFVFQNLIPASSHRALHIYLGPFVQHPFGSPFT